MRFCSTLWALSVLVGFSVQAALGKPSEDRQPPARQNQREPLQIEDPPEPFKPRREKTSHEKNRLEALSHFAAGRMHEQRGEYADALRLYQRALRYDPTAMPVLQRVIDVAGQLGRLPEMVRYMLMGDKLDQFQPVQLERLGHYFSEQRQYDDALRLYERSAALRKDDTKSSEYILLQQVMGEVYIRVEQFEKAAGAFGLVIDALEKPKDYGLDAQLVRQLQGENGRNYILYADAYLKTKRPQLARSAFEKLQQINPNDGLHAYHMAEVLELQDEPENALKQLQAYFDAHLSTAGIAPYELLKELLEKMGGEKELISRLEKTFAEDKDNVPLRYFLAEKYCLANQWSKAEPLYVELIEDAATADAYRGLITVYRQVDKIEPLLELLGEVADKTGGLDAVEEEAKTLVADSDILSRLIAAARKTAAPQDVGQDRRGIFLAVAALAMEAKKFSESGEFFELSLVGKPDNAALILRAWGLGLLMAEKNAEAAKVFRRAIDEGVAPDDPLFHTYLAIALTMEDKFEEALKVARAAADLGNNEARLESRIPWILYHAKRYDEASEGYRQLIERFDSQYLSEGVRQTIREARLILSNICVIRKNLPEAEEWLEQVLDEFPDDISASNDLGYLWADQGKHLDRALTMIEKAVAAEPDNTAYRDSLGWVYYKLGRYEEALVELKKACAGEDPDGVILDHLGDAYLKNQQLPAACEAWQRALKAFEENEEDHVKRVTEKLRQHKPKDEDKPAPQLAPATKPE